MELSAEGNPQLSGNLAHRPAAARQQSDRFPLEFIREVTTRRTHQTPSCSLRSLVEVSTISREGQIHFQYKLRHLERRSATRVQQRGLDYLAPLVTVRPPSI